MKAQCVRALVLVLSLLLIPVVAQATLFTWTGTSSNAWNVNANWGGSGFPNSYADQATIPGTTGSNKPVILSTSALVGGGGTALTIGGATSGSTVNALDINASGFLGMQGGISIGTRRTLIIEGTLENDSAAPGTTYTITGSPIMSGGTISALNGGGWSAGGISGYGTISAPITTTGVISNNVANQTLHITGSVTTTAQRGLGGTSTLASGARLSIEGGTITGTGSGSGITNYNLVNLRGSFDNISLYNDGSYNGAVSGDWNYYNLTGDSAWNNGALNIMKFNGHKLDATGSIINYSSVGNYVNVDTGILNNPGAATTTISNGGFVTLGGGSITSTGGGSFSFSTNIKGYGAVSAPVTCMPSGGMSAANGALTISSSVYLNGSAWMSSGTGSAKIALAGANISATGSKVVDSSTVSGYGVISAPFDNNGKVIGDGNGSDANVLDFSASSALTPGANTGGLGWFAQNHGKVVLPAVQVPAGGTYYWGGQMVNSVAMTLNGATAGAQSISLLSPDRADVAAGLTNPIGVWAFSAGGPTFTSASLSFRYDDALATSLGLNQSNLKLVGYDGSSWITVPINAVDTASKLVSTSAPLTSFYRDYAIELLLPHPGDANNDGAVDVVDLGVLAKYYDSTGLTPVGYPGSWQQGDFNNDGAVDVIDLGVLAKNYDWTGAPAEAVPEPATLSLLAAGGLVMLRRNRK